MNEKGNERRLLDFSFWIILKWSEKAWMLFSEPAPSNSLSLSEGELSSYLNQSGPILYESLPCTFYKEWT